MAKTKKGHDTVPNKTSSVKKPTNHNNKATGPIVKFPESNYQSKITVNKYLETKKIIEDSLINDWKYCKYKLKQCRMGGDGVMETYLRKYINDLQNEQSRYTEDCVEYDKYSEEYSVDDENESFSSTDDVHKEQFINKDNDNKKRLYPIDNVPLQDSVVGENTNKNKRQKTLIKDVNNIPSDLVFPKDLYEKEIEELPKPRELDEPTKLKLLTDHLDSEQMDRFEVFRRTRLPKQMVRRLANLVTNQSVPMQIAIVLGTVGKLFVGEIVEKALLIKQKHILQHMLDEYIRRKLYGNRILKILKKLTKLCLTSGNYASSNNSNSKTANTATTTSDTDIHSKIEEKEEEQMSMAKEGSTEKTAATLKGREHNKKTKDDTVGAPNIIYTLEDIANDGIYANDIYPDFESMINDIDEDDYEPPKANSTKLKQHIVTLTVLLNTTDNSAKIRNSLLKQFNYWGTLFNKIDIKVDKYTDTPLLPEHLREAWRLYRLENKTLPSGTFRQQGEGNGWMFE
ncbi:uncharacterized protein SCODWIG_02892 [Saccharomycodes ludwigii]|uniref:TAFII28-like protein domain-containing protein n=1 Tax=Saccharomycodes ludwigii TaxID=36035 RepID=A0A376B936_9ASCO|nr:hypothetical protein SCDLUD_003324 [Saccharomycodes ludwigii]KAH3900350.1 hypothetical protein SCDLUD_003324 [Saccharomycodes ludwigii]SSD61131.1 uncharacterized protein SCODWIG_02892 [Saccharomycodes ludwigii]